MPAHYPGPHLHAAHLPQEHGVRSRALCPHSPLLARPPPSPPVQLHAAHPVTLHHITLQHITCGPPLQVIYHGASELLPEAAKQLLDPSLQPLALVDSSKVPYPPHHRPAQINGWVSKVRGPYGGRRGEGEERGGRGQ